MDEAVYRESNVNDGQAPAGAGADMDTEGTLDEVTASAPAT